MVDNRMKDIIAAGRRACTEQQQLEEMALRISSRQKEGQRAEKEEYEKLLDIENRDGFAFMKREFSRAAEGYETAESTLRKVLRFAMLHAEVMKYVWKDVLNELFGLDAIKVSVEQTIKAALLMVKQRVSEPDIMLPILCHFVELDDQDIFQCEPLSIPSVTLGDKEQKKVQNLFNEEVGNWLVKRGFKFQTDATGLKTGKITDLKDTSVLTKDDFNELRDNADNGLNAHLKEVWRMEIEQELPPASPRPGL